MTIKEQITQTLDRMSESELYQVAEYLSFLRFRARTHVKPALDTTRLAGLYAEFADEDCQLAEGGMENYAADLQAEDAK